MSSTLKSSPQQSGTQVDRHVFYLSGIRSKKARAWIERHLKTTDDIEQATAILVPEGKKLSKELHHYNNKIRMNPLPIGYLSDKDMMKGPKKAGSYLGQSEQTQFFTEEDAKNVEYANLLKQSRLTYGVHGTLKYILIHPSDLREPEAQWKTDVPGYERRPIVLIGKDVYEVSDSAKVLGLLPNDKQQQPFDKLGLLARYIRCMDTQYPQCHAVIRREVMINLLQYVQSNYAPISDASAGFSDQDAKTVVDYISSWFTIPSPAGAVDVAKQIAKDVPVVILTWVSKLANWITGRGQIVNNSPMPLIQEHVNNVLSQAYQKHPTLEAWSEDSGVPLVTLQLFYLYYLSWIVRADYIEEQKPQGNNNNDNSNGQSDEQKTVILMTKAYSDRLSGLLSKDVVDHAISTYTLKQPRDMAVYKPLGIDKDSSLDGKLDNLRWWASAQYIIFRQSAGTMTTTDNTWTTKSQYRILVAIISLMTVNGILSLDPSIWASLWNFAGFATNLAVGQLVKLPLNLASFTLNQLQGLVMGPGLQAVKATYGAAAGFSSSLYGNVAGMNASMWPHT